MNLQLKTIVGIVKWAIYTRSERVSNRLEHTELSRTASLEFWGWDIR